MINPFTLPIEIRHRGVLIFTHAPLLRHVPSPVDASQEILSAVTLSAYSLEGLDPEWQAQLRQLDARLAVRRL